MVMSWPPRAYRVSLTGQFSLLRLPSRTERSAVAPQPGAHRALRIGTQSSRHGLADSPPSRRGRLTAAKGLRREAASFLGGPVHYKPQRRK